MKRLIISITTAVFVLAAALYLLFPLFIKPDVVEGHIFQAIEKITRGSMQVGEWHISRSPKPLAVIKDIKLNLPMLKLPGIKGAELTAPEAAVVFSLRSAWGDHGGVAGVSVRGGELRLRPSDPADNEDIIVRNLSVTVEPLRFGPRMKVQVKGDLADVPGSFSLRGFLSVGQSSKWDWTEIAFDFQAAVNDLPAAFVFSRKPMSAYMEVLEGTVSADFGFRKISRETETKGTVEVDAKQWIYGLRRGEKSLLSQPIDFEGAAQLTWDPKAESLLIESASVTSQLGLFEAYGNIHLGTREIQALTVTASNVALEMIPKYWIGLQRVIPYNIGFSGQSQLEMTLEGTPGHLSMHAHWDLSPTLLTYSRYFSKPKDFPLNVSFETILKEGSVLTGDFSVRLKEVTMKGSLKNFDMKTGMGQLNIITNKFSLAGWQALVPPIADYQVRGKGKVLANFEGKLANLNETKTMMNVTLENVDVLTQDGEGVRDVNMALDFGSVVLELNDTRFEIGGAPIALDLAVYGIAGDRKAKLTLKSPSLEPVRVLKAAKNVVHGWWGRAGFLESRELETFLLDGFPEGTQCQNLELALEYEDRIWKISELKFNAYDGDVDVQGELDLTSEIPIYWAHSTINRLSFARFLGRRDAPKRVLDGNFFLDMSFTGQGTRPVEWREHLLGEGAFTLTNGEFYTFDVLDAIGNVPELRSATTYSSGTTPFHDVTARFFLKGGKVLTEELVLVSDDAWAQAEGELTLDGMLNFGLRVYLESSLAKQIFEDAAMNWKASEAEAFGPIPLLLSGPLGNPDLKVDPAIVPGLMKTLLAERSRQSFGHFLPEELFFKGRENL
ncbi:MAG: AsmA-like C-terminal region-containing protein [Candidatus Omnitrophota bacterium]|nr:AsmA-like C-terminal region-containing protein [Candidatus Omnitrophota bacterium]